MSKRWVYGICLPEYMYRWSPFWYGEHFYPLQCTLLSFRPLITFIESTHLPRYMVVASLTDSVLAVVAQRHADAENSMYVLSMSFHRLLMLVCLRQAMSSIEVYVSWSRNIRPLLLMLPLGLVVPGIALVVRFFGGRWTHLRCDCRAV